MNVIIIVILVVVSITLAVLYGLELNKNVDLRHRNHRSDKLLLMGSIENGLPIVATKAFKLVNNSAKVVIPGNNNLTLTVNGNIVSDPTGTVTMNGTTATWKNQIPNNHDSRRVFVIISEKGHDENSFIMSFRVYRDMMGL